MNIKQEFKRFFKPRKKSSDKNDFGRIFVLAGSEGLSGACVMTALAALRSGAGLVTAGVPRRLVLPLAKRLTEVMTFPLAETRQGTISKYAAKTALHFLKTQDVFALGPGLSLHPETQQAVRGLVSRSERPMVIDADALNAFREKAKLLVNRKAPAILTPHGGEFARLFGGKIPKGDRERKSRALGAAKKYRLVMVLKGHHTVVASPEGRSYVNQTGNPGMATGGSGDILTGVIAAILAQAANPFQAACFGVFIHGFAGDIAAREKGEISLIAGDILEALPLAFQRVLGQNRAR